MDDSCICQQFAAANDSFAGRDELTIIFVQFEDHGIATTTTYQATCQRCGRRWHIREMTGYHYPLYSWSLISGE